MKIGSFQPLALKKEILSVRKKGFTIKENLLSIKFLKKTENKVAFIIKKKIGIAVERNKIKNQIRSIIRATQLFNENCIHCMIKIHDDSIKKTPFQNIRQEVELMFLKCYKKIKG